jgi:cytoskeletal protein RodZ
VEILKQVEVMNKVDKFFKDKLEGHSLQPSPQAWEKVESHLSKKNRMVLWLRVAAAFALLGLLTFALMTWNGYTSNENEIVETEKQKPVAPEKQEVAPAPQQQVAEAPSKKRDQTSRKPQKTEQRTADVVTDDVIQIPEPQQVALNEATTANNELQAATEEPQVTAQLVEKPIVIVYSLPSIKKKEVTPEPIVADAAKKTGLERVLEIAKEVKNSDSPLADLREAKDDIFALEFRNKDKSKKQN